jgi:hypothetical protein
MDHHVFDSVTRLFGASGSRRAAWRTLLAGALLGFTTRSAVAAPCANDANSRCTCGTTRNCAPGKCFVKCGGGELCCTEPDFVICGNRCCFITGSADPCAECPQARAGDVCPSGIAGSYRRR